MTSVVIKILLRNGVYCSEIESVLRLVLVPSREAAIEHIKEFDKNYCARFTEKEEENNEYYHKYFIFDSYGKASECEEYKV